MLLALAGVLVPAAGAAAQTPSASQFQAVSYRLLSRTPVAGQPANKPLFDYVYKVDVRNGGSVPGDVSGHAVNKGNSFSLVDADAAFGAVLAGQTRTSSDTITVRAKSSFDRSLDVRSVKNGAWQFNEAGKDDDDASIAALPKNVADWNDGAVTSYYNTKLHSLLQWTFLVRFDTSAPTIGQLLPQGAVNTATPELSASYTDNDGLGVDLATISMMLDGVDISAQLIKTASGLSYLPAQPLGQGTHTAILSVADMTANVGGATWSFSVDTLLPVIGNLLPANAAPVARSSIVSAQLSDDGGIDSSTVNLKIDGVDVSDLAVKSTTAISFAPAAGFSDGRHTVALSVRDTAGNSAAASWEFIVDASGPAVTVPLPADGSLLAADAIAQIGAQFHDGAGVRIDTVALEVDGADVTSKATVSASGVEFTPLQALFEGNHTVRLTVDDTFGNRSVQEWSFKTASAPVITGQSPIDVFLPGGAAPVISAAYSDVGAGIDAASVRLLFDGVDVSARATVGATGIHYTVPAALADATHIAVLSLSDKAGNGSESTWKFVTATAPVIGAVAPRDVTLPSGSRPAITAVFGDSRLGIDVASIKLLFDGEDVTAQAQVTASSVSFTPAAPLAEGAHSVYLEVGNTANAAANAVWGFEIDTPSIYTVAIASPASGTVAPLPRIEVVASATSNKSYPVALSVGGIDMAVQRTTGPGAEIARYGASVDLVDGINKLLVVATYADGQTSSATTEIVYHAPPVLTITSPLDKANFGPVNPNSPRDLTGKVERPVVVTGTVSKPVQSVTVNQQVATVSPSGMEFRFDNFFLHEGINLLSAVATDVHGKTGSASVTVAVDQTAPLLSIEAPLAGAVTSSARVDVRGVVNDAIEGWIGVPYAQVSVTNGANGKTSSAKVGDRFYIAEDVALEVGANALTVSAIDQAGNRRSKVVEITRIGVGSDRLTLLAGNRQRGAVNAAVPKPLAIVALARDGNPLAGLPVTFDVLRGTGSIGLEPGAAPAGQAPARNLSVVTDEAGRAQVWLTLGKQSGEAGNMVRASNPSVGEDVVFTASGEKGVPSYIRADAGASQYGETSASSLEPLSAIVTDSEENRLPGATVVFRVEEGDAGFADANGNITASLQLTTDKNGMAAARPLLGARAGLVRVSASAVDPLSQSQVTGASYQINVLQQQDGPTRFSGKVLSHTGAPLAGVRLSIGRTALSATTDDTGFFTFDSQVPPGKLDLFIDGRTANVQTGQYPALHFEALAVRGQNNVLPHAIHLPPLLLSEAKIVGGDQDVTLRIPGFEGFEMVVKANSATFPDGSKVGPLVISPVQQDKLPMVPPGGYNGFMAPAWTIQPSGVRFDPPIQVKVPNSLGLKPGETRELYQWDHDLATFAPMGRATVSEDGALLVSDANSGLTKAGWGGSPNPPPDPNKCAPPSQKCADCLVRKTLSGATCPTCEYDKTNVNPAPVSNTINYRIHDFGPQKALKQLVKLAFGLEIAIEGSVVGQKIDKAECCDQTKGRSNVLVGQLGLQGEASLLFSLNGLGPVGRTLAVAGLKAGVKGILNTSVQVSAEVHDCPMDSPQEKERWDIQGNLGGALELNVKAGELGNLTVVGFEGSAGVEIQGQLLSNRTPNKPNFDVNSYINVYAEGDLVIFNQKIHGFRMHIPLQYNDSTSAAVLFP